MSGVGLTPLSEFEEKRLAHCEAVIDRDLEQARNVYSALAEIRTRKLYRHKYGTFEEYAQSRFGISRSRAYQLIAASAVCEAIRGAPTKSGEVREILPTNERQVRTLSKLEPPQIVEAWDNAVDSADGNVPTNKQVKEAVGKFEGKQERQEQKACSAFVPPSYIADAVKSLEYKGLSLSTCLIRAIDDVRHTCNHAFAVVLEPRIGALWFKSAWCYPVCLLDVLVKFPVGRKTAWRSAVVVLVCKDYREWEEPFIEAFGKHGTIILPTDTEGVCESVRC